MTGEVYRKIVWLASYPKSGNTWTRLFLDAYFLGEVDINDMVTSVSDDNSIRYQVGDGSDAAELPIHIQNLMRPAAMLRLVRAFNENRHADVPLFVKTHSANMVANGIEQIPEALTKGVIYIVRDPRDVVSSYQNHMGNETIEQAIDNMCKKYQVLTPDKGRSKCAQVISSWDQHVKSFWYTDSHDLLRIRYEDIKADPVENFIGMLRFAGIEPDRERVERAVELTQLDRLKEQEQEKGFREASEKAEKGFFGDGGGWKKKLTPAQKNKIERKMGRTMKKLGYL